MILPLPVPPGCPENAVRFINLEAYPEYFTDMDALFPAPMTLGIDRSLAEARAPLAVHDVGQFESSFIPSIPDFSRLDSRFRLPANVWRDLPQYRDWGLSSKLYAVSVPARHAYSHSASVGSRYPFVVWSHFTSSGVFVADSASPVCFRFDTTMR